MFEVQIRPYFFQFSEYLAVLDLQQGIILFVPPLRGVYFMFLMQFIDAAILPDISGDLLWFPVVNFFDLT